MIKSSPRQVTSGWVKTRDRRERIIRDRILDSLTPADVTKVNSLIGTLQVAGVEKDLAAAVKAAAGVREFVAGVQAMSR